MENKLADSNGFLTKWLICGPKLNIPEIVVEEEIQEKFESKMREAIPDDNFTVPMNIYLDETCSGQNWKYWYGGNGIFVDISNFYRLICRVEFYRGLSSSHRLINYSFMGKYFFPIDPYICRRITPQT